MKDMNSGTIEEIEPRLIPELECEIFTLALHNHGQDKLNLLLVAKRVHSWLVPLTYRSLFINDYRYPPAAGLERYGHLAENVLVMSLLTPKIPPDTILRCCPNIRNLAFWGAVYLTERVFDLTKLTHLFMRGTSFFEPYYRTLLSDSQSENPTHTIPRIKIQNLFSSITHLALYERLALDTPQGTSVPTSIRILQAFTSLSHLSLYEYSPEGAFSLALTHLPKLKVLIYLHCVYEDAEKSFVIPCRWTLRHLSTTDHRLVLMNGHFTEDWKRGVSGEKDIWKLAEEAIAKR
ncbi:hypothetical protein BDN72DRAFT_897257 [Pluteus cervinus]|uniref:Uncharacterized protein n=1 Tax=Pluteus cervinus TaxID=181527 RepID=A0ACD3AUQ6_9AGAR|nr:hypothetical protein BDN72DRAFT_897257 [Pluteus cervinus]